MPKAKRFCPYLGMYKDRDTCVSYPSLGNRCYRNTKPVRVLLEYQESCCLADNYQQCPVYAGGGKIELAKSYQEPDALLQRRVTNWLVRAVVVLLVVGTGWISYQNREKLMALLPSADVGQETHVDYAAPTFVIGTAESEVYQPQILTTAMHDRTSTALPVIETTQPNMTATLQGPENGKGLMVHRILAGENLERLAEEYYTSPAAILDINYKLAPPIPADKTIVIPEGIVKTGKLPQFEVKYIPEKTKVAFIVEKFDCNLALFQQYNQSIIITSLKVEYILDKQWVLIPRARAKNKSP